MIIKGRVPVDAQSKLSLGVDVPRKLLVDIPLVPNELWPFSYPWLRSTNAWNSRPPNEDYFSLNEFSSQTFLWRTSLRPLLHDLWTLTHSLHLFDLHCNCCIRYIFHFGRFFENTFLSPLYLRAQIHARNLTQNFHTWSTFFFNQTDIKISPSTYFFQKKMLINGLFYK